MEVYCLWVNIQERVVSFHPVEGYACMEFADKTMYVNCVDSYAQQSYRYQ